MPEIDSFEKLVSVLNEAKKLSAQIETSWSKIEKSASGASSGAGGMGGGTGGQSGNGKGSKSVIGGHDGSGPPKKQTEPMSGSKLGLAAFSNVGKALTIAGSRTDTGGDSQLAAVGKRAMGGLGGAMNNVSRMMDNSAFVQSGGTFGAGAMSKNAAFAAMAPEQQQVISSSLYGMSDAMALVKNVTNAANQFLPDMNGTMNRATGYYNATTYGGNTQSRTDVASATLDTMKNLGGITSAGSDANVASYLSGKGMTVSKDPNSTYQQTLRTTANASRYMNISNEQAAASVESLTGAKGSANMLKNFGIYTADLTTGKEKTQGQIFEELAGRLTAGRGQASVEQTQASIRRGALGVTVDSFFQGDQQSASMFKQYMVERAKAGGKGVMDFASATPTATALGNAGNVNPLQNQMSLAGSQSAAMGQAEDPYIKGINVATGALSALTDAAGGLSKGLGTTAAILQTLLGNSQFKGAVNGVSSVVDFASKGVSGIGNVLAGMNPMNPAPSLIQAGIIGASMGAGVGVAATILGTTNAAGYLAGSTGGGAASPSMSSSISNPFAAKGGQGAAATSLSGSSFSSGSDFSNIPGMDAAKSASSSGGSAATAGAPMVDQNYYLKSFQVTTTYGTPDATPRHNLHNAVDYAMPEGTPIYAVADGTVVMAVTGQPKNDMNSSPWSGNTVKLKHLAADGTVFFSLYGHLSELKVSQNQQVARGQLIGLSGQTGSATGPHLHLQYENASGTPIPESMVASLIEGNNPYAATGDTSSSGNNSGGYNQSTLTAGVTAGAQLQQVPTAAVNAFNTLQGLYSGNQSQILDSVQAIAGSKGIDASMLQQYINSAPGSVNSATGVRANTPGGGGGNNNNVSITVQVPDVTSADALKFAQLVKSYLDNNTLMSNTGSV